MFKTSFSTAFDFSVFSFNKRKISHVRHMAFRWLTWENMNSYKIAHYNIKSTGQMFSVWCYSFLFPSTVMLLIQTVTYFLWKIMSGQLSHIQQDSTEKFLISLRSTTIRVLHKKLITVVYFLFQLKVLLYFAVSWWYKIYCYNVSLGCTKGNARTFWNTSNVRPTKSTNQELSVSISTGKERNAESSLNSKSFVLTEEGY